MNDRPWWAVALQWAAWGAIMTVVMGWLARSRAAAPESGEGELVPPRSTLVVAVATTVLFVTIAGLSVAFPGTDPSPWPTVVFLLFALLGLVMVVDHRRGRHTLTPDGLRYGKLLGAGGTLRWDEVRRLAWSESAKWFRLETTDGRVVRISAMLVGLPHFATAALERLPAGVVEARARAVLGEIRRGELPSIWG